MVKMEVFSGDPPCPSCAAVLELTRVYAEKYPGQVEVITYIGKAGLGKFQEYKLGCVPAVVINTRIRVEGICPTPQTLDRALAEGGL